MEIDSPESNAFLFELYTQTRGDVDAQTSMTDVGNALGLDKAAAGALAEALFIQEFAELKTLSGGIGITRKGLDLLQVKLPPKAGAPFDGLGTGPVLESQGQASVERIVHEIKTGLYQASPAYEQVEEMMMDIKTIETQMLSPRPKVGIIREGLQSLNGCIKKTGPKALTRQLENLINS